jgi:hypothetical protein
MSRLPIAIGTSAFIAITMCCLLFVVDSGLIARSSAAMIVLGLMELALAGLAGLILARAPWARWLLGATVIVSAVLATSSSSAFFWPAVAMGALAIIGLSGPWLTLWVRQQPVADRLGVVPAALMATAGAAPILVGLAAHTGVEAVHWVLVATTLASAWAYGRGLGVGIWGFRVLLPVVGLAAAFRTIEPGNIAIALGALAVAIMGWSPQAKRVTAVITPPLREPISRKEAGDANR